MDSEAKNTKALHDVKYGARNLSASLMRIIAGGGDPAELQRHMMMLYDGLADLSPEDGCAAVREALDPFRAYYDSRPWIANPDRSETRIAEDHIYKFAIRTVAATLVGNHSHESRNNSEMHSAIRWWQKAVRGA